MTETKDRAERLLEILDLENLEQNLYRGENEVMPGNRLFGGQVLAQALTAANRTVESNRPCHSLHGYFLRPGRPDIPAVYRVERIRDGKSFCTRRIVAIQNGEAIFSMDASFHIKEQGLEHQMDMRSLPAPEELEDDIVVAKRNPVTNSPWATRERPFALRTVSQKKTFDDNSNPVWIRFKKTIGNDLSSHQELLAYASDMGFVSTSYLPHSKMVSRDDVQMASLDHALWFHNDFDISQWIVYIKDSTSTHGAKGFNRGSFYTKQGKLIASSMQEGLLRVNKPR